MKFSLISATSVLALFSASLGPAQAGVVSATSSPLNIYDLVQDGMTSADGGDATVSAQDLPISAVAALEASTDGWQKAGFAGRFDPVAVARTGYAAVPLGASAGTKPDQDLALSVTGGASLEPAQRAFLIGQARMASLVGTVGNGPAPKEKPGNTVFTASGSNLTFNDVGDDTGRQSGPAVGYAFAPSSTSTATITVAGAGNYSRQYAGSGAYVVAANSLQTTPPVDASSAQGLTLAQSAQPTMGYSYTPTGANTAKGPAIAASFSDAITAIGDMAQVIPPPASTRVLTSQAETATTGVGQLASAQAGDRLQTSQATARADRANEVVTSQGRKPADSLTGGTIQTSDAQPRAGRPGPDRPDQFLTSQIQKTQFQALDSAGSGKLAELTPTLFDPRANSKAEGTRTLISTSVSANPSETAATYMASVIRRTPTGGAAPSVEAFEIGPVPGSKTQANAATTVSDPLRGKVMASAGALNNSLALP